MALWAAVVWRAMATPPRPADDDLTYEHFSAGAALLASGNPAQAAVRLEKARAAEPEKAGVREALGRAYFALGRWNEAETEFRATLRVCPTNDYAHYALSRVLRSRGRRREADTHLKLARAMGCHLARPSGSA